MSKELVSIVTSLYNYARYIPDLIQSVLNQTYPIWELIIVDDGSTDNPLQAIQPFLKERRIHFIQLSKNMGYAKAKNEGIIRSKGEYIVMIDADDMLTANSIRVRKNVLDKNPNKLWCHGEVSVTDNDGKTLSDRSFQWKKKFRAKLIRDGMNLEKDYHHRLIHAQSVMVRPEFHKKLGLYDESLRFSADNEMWRRAICFTYIPVHINDMVAIYRVHPARMSRSNYKKQRMHKVKGDIIRMVEKRFKEGINETNTRIWYEKI